MNENTQVNISLEIKNLNVVLFALSKLPYEQVVELIQNIREQATAELSKESDKAE